MRVKQVEYIKDYKLKLVFSDKTIKIVDLENMVKKSSGIFSPLKDLDYFKKVTLDDCQLSICWPNGADICPDILYEMETNKPKKKPLSTKPVSKRPKRTSKKSLISK